MATSFSGWGRYPRASCRVIVADDTEKIPGTVAAADSLIARGNGRAYGDAAFNLRGTLPMGSHHQILAFDPATGVLTAEAGLLLADLIDEFAPRGWFPPVTPGTKFVSLGGMIAADVHGKNHHVTGSIGSHVASFDLALADGRVVGCSPGENAALFAATLGGMGLTGVILRATVRLMPIETTKIRRETLRAANLDAVMALFEASQSWTYSVAWIDCLSGGGALGRSVLQRGEHATAAEVPGPDSLALPQRGARRIPFDFPTFALNPWSVRLFNALYWNRSRPGTDIVDLDPFFYPLDAVLEWNRIYGRHGFFQYQCVLPTSASRSGLMALLERIRASGSGSFLSVLKRFGPQDGMLSFPMEGYTLALDFPVTSATLRLADELDAIVADHGGRLYLAKDARMAPAMLRGYPRLGEFEAVRTAVDPGRKFASALSLRLGL
jgi:FAD/FMN-containing dehydrogenase